MRRLPHPAKRAFTLVELSIVLVILGLLVGGVLTGQSLIRASELRSVMTDHTKYLTATNAFKDKYLALPGDMVNATSFWGVKSGSCAMGASIAQLTCNGDGDGLLSVTEGYAFWQHLSNAGLIEGAYSGTSDPNSEGDPHAIGGINVPQSKINNAVWTTCGAYQNIVTTGDSGMYAGKYGNAFWFGAADAGDYFSLKPVIKAEEAWNIDSKMDDGKPGTGSIVTRVVFVTDCITADLSSYLLSNTSNGCALIFKTNL